jgi:predicted XRE-type DNA-binding protein
MRGKINRFGLDAVVNTATAVGLKAELTVWKQGNWFGFLGGN